MKKPLLLFVFLMIAGTWLFSLSNLEKQNLYAEIARAPAYAQATAEGTIERKVRRMSNHHVQYTYQVEGTTYQIESESMGPEQIQALAARPDPQVVYAAGTPAKAVMKHDFDRHAQTKSMGRAIFEAAIAALFFSIIICIVFTWKFGWLKRRNA